MNYEETIQYLYDKLPLFSSLGKKAYKADLTNTLALCKYLDDPQKKLTTIHIAGTNGKGSVSSMLASVFQQCGYKTGLYTSPHLKDFRERIKVNGVMIDKKFIIDFTERIKKISEEIEPSFFELTFVMALEYFVHQKTEVCIIEAGLGGRLDSTNVITPLVSVITNIGYDHTDILGDTLEKIAFEKAGIIKKNTPVIIGEVLPETKNVFIQKAEEENAAITFAEDPLSIVSSLNIKDRLYVVLHDNQLKKDTGYSLDLTGFYQAKNLRTSITVMQQLKNNFVLKEPQIKFALAHVKELSGLHGRWDVISRSPLLVLDVAHNTDGIQQVVTQINNTSYKNLHIVFGMVKDKEIDKVLQLLPKDASYYFTRAQIPRALPEDELLQKAKAYNLIGESFPEVNLALKAATRKAFQDDMIIVCGSVFVVGEVNI